MNIAICVTGHLRCYKEMQPNYEKFKRVVEKFGNVDVFVSTWDKKNSNYSWSSKAGHQNSDDEKISITADDVVQHYNPKKYIILNNDFYCSRYSPLQSDIVSSHANRKLDDEFVDNGIVNGYKQYFVIHHASILKKLQEFETGQKYDVVIRIRPDYFFRKQFLDILNLNNICANTVYTDLHGAEASDQFYYGASDAMDVAMSNFLRMGYGIENWQGEAGSFSQLILAFHPTMKFNIIKEKIGVIPNYPILENFATFNDVSTIPSSRYR